MRYTIEGFSQAEAVKFKKIEIVKDSKGNDKEKIVTLDCTDLVILRWFVDFYPNMMKVEIGGRQYAWVNYQALIEDMPLLGFKKGMLALRFKKMVDFGILEHKTVKSGGTFSYYGFGNQYMRLIDTEHTQQNTDPAQNIEEGLHKKLDTPSENISDQIDPSTKDSSTRDNSKEGAPIEEIVAYLNEKAGRSFSPKAKATREIIEARWKETPNRTVDDFKKVIDNMAARWIGTDYEEYLQPSTLFRPSHFDEYLNKPAIKPKQEHHYHEFGHSQPVLRAEDVFSMHQDTEEVPDGKIVF